MILVCLSGLISRALPREGFHGDSKERPLMTGSIMQGKAHLFSVSHSLTAGIEQ